MPLFSFHGLDKTDGGAAIRAENRQDHLEWVAGLGDMVKIGGPFLADDAETLVGSFIVYEVDSRAALDALVTNDPYMKADLFERIEVRPFLWLLADGQRRG